jgi:hypothetical protein
MRYRMTDQRKLRMLQMNTGTRAAAPWSSIEPDLCPVFRKQDRLRAAAALIDAALLSALIWSLLAATLG